MNISGKSKLGKEKEWLETKHNDGFYFFTKKPKLY